MPSFIKDVQEIRRRAEQKIEDGPVTAGYKIDRNRAIEVLNEALATEIVCVLRYMHHYFMATGVHGRTVAGEFKEHADEERHHADMIGERIQQLGGSPDFNPGTLVQRSVSHYVPGETLADMIREDLIAERMVIEVYQGMIRFFGDGDPTTRRMMEEILEEEEEHASELSDMLYIVNPESGKTEGEDPGTNPLHLERGQKQQPKMPRTGTLDAALSRDNPARGIASASESTEMGKNVSPNRAAPEKIPVTGGRTMNRRNDREEIDTDDVADAPIPGASTGGTRSPKVLEKNRKSKRAA